VHHKGTRPPKNKGNISFACVSLKKQQKNSENEKTQPSSKLLEHQVNYRNTQYPFFLKSLPFN